MHSSSKLLRMEDEHASTMLCQGAALERVYSAEFDTHKVGDEDKERWRYGRKYDERNGGMGRTLDEADARSMGRPRLKLENEVEVRTER